MTENGNNAVMREALKAVIEKLLDCAPTAEQEWPELVQRARAALSAPARNCGRFQTAEDAKKEFNYLWNFVWKRGGGYVDEPKYRSEYEKWLFSPIQEGETNDCGYTLCSHRELCEAKTAIQKDLAKPSRNCDRFGDELDAQLAFPNEEWLISVDRDSMLEKDRFENWTDEMKYVLPQSLCNEDCNNCEIHQNRQFSLLINILHEKFGDEVYRVTQSVCPNMTCCADCHIDDFCHDRGCKILKEAKAIVKAWYPKSKPRKKGNVHDNA